MKKLLAILAIICVASAQVDCAWDYLNTLAGKLMGTKTQLNLCGCYQNGRALVQVVLMTVQNI